MKRSLIVCTLALLGAVALNAGAYEKDVETLGNSVERSGAFERLAQAGDEAFEDLMDGLKLDPDQAGISADEAGRRGAIRRECARLLGALKDTRASAKLLDLLRAGTSDPLLSTACAIALGNIWGEKEPSNEREEVANELKALAGNPEADNRVRWAALRGLARMGTGIDVAGPMIGNEEISDILRGAAIDVVVAASDQGSADTLIAIWEKQRGDEPGEYTKALGVRALFGLARLEDERAVSGLVDVATMREFSGKLEWPERAVSLMASDALREKAIAELVAVFKDVDRQVQHQGAARCLGEFGAAGVTAYLAISDDDAPEGEESDYYRKQVDRWLSSLRTEAALAAFIEAYGKVDEENTGLRARIFEHISGNRRSIKQSDTVFFREVADDESLDVSKRAQAIDAWAEAQGKESLADLERWVKSEQGEIRAQAVRNLGKSYIPLAKSKPLLMEALQSEGEEFAEARRTALQGLQRSNDKDLLPLFLERLDPEKEPDAEVRRRAIQAIDGFIKTAGIDEDEAYPALKARLDDPDASVRAQALNRVVVMANNLGRSGDATGVVEKALADSAGEVRVAAYGRVALVSREIDSTKVMRAALLEETRDQQSAAVNALAQLNDFGDDTEQQKRLVDLALRIVDVASHRNDAGKLLAAIDENVPALKKYITDSVRAQIETYRESQNYTSLPVLIRTLIAIDDVTYYNEIKELAEFAHVDLRKACIEYFAETGTKNDIPFLRQLKERTDSAADAVRGQIDSAIRKLEDRG